MLNRFLFTRIDNSSLLLFRIFFGILVSLECYGAIATGWVRRNLIEPQFTFTFIGFEWLQPLPGSGMYFYFIVMGTLGIFIALGYKYRFSIVLFTLLWSGVYLMQKTAYNNHYYLLILVSFLMCFFPAHRNYSLDARKNPALKTNSMYGYVKWIVVLQLFLVYTYAALAKLYPDWLDLTFIKLLMRSKGHYYYIGDLMQHPLVHQIICVAGILFDLLIIPALLWKKTRKLAFGCAILFHLFNSIVFQIGIFPYLSLAFIVFFFEPKTIQAIFFKNKPLYTENKLSIPKWKSIFLWGWGIYFLIQVALPLRHHFFEDDVLWTEEGHRMSWRMMLRNRGGTIQFRIVNHTNGQSSYVALDNYVTRQQKEKLSSYPDFIWQFAQRLKKEYAEKGEHISVYVTSRVSINGKARKLFIDPKIDLANEIWQPLKHHSWILPSEQTP